MLKWTLVFPPTNRGFLEGLSIVLDYASSAFVSDTYRYIGHRRLLLVLPQKRRILYLKNQKVWEHERPHILKIIDEIVSSEGLEILSVVLRLS